MTPATVSIIMFAVHLALVILTIVVFRHLVRTGERSWQKARMVGAAGVAVVFAGFTFANAIVDMWMMAQV